MGDGGAKRFWGRGHVRTEGVAGLAADGGVGSRDGADFLGPVVDRNEYVGGGERDPGFGLPSAVLLDKGGLVAVDELLQGAGLQAALGSFLSDGESDIMTSRGLAVLDFADRFAPPLEPDEAEGFLADDFLHADQFIIQGIERGEGAALPGGGETAGNPAVLVDPADALVYLGPGSLGKGSGLV